MAFPKPDLNPFENVSTAIIPPYDIPAHDTSPVHL